MFPKRGLSASHVCLLLPCAAQHVSHDARSSFVLSGSRGLASVEQLRDDQTQRGDRVCDLQLTAARCRGVRVATPQYAQRHGYRFASITRSSTTSRLRSCSSRRQCGVKAKLLIAWLGLVCFSCKQRTELALRAVVPALTVKCRPRPSAATHRPWAQDKASSTAPTRDPVTSARTPPLRAKHLPLHAADGDGSISAAICGHVQSALELPRCGVRHGMTCASLLRQQRRPHLRFRSGTGIPQILRVAAAVLG